MEELRSPPRKVLCTSTLRDTHAPVLDDPAKGVSDWKSLKCHLAAKGKSPAIPGLGRLRQEDHCEFHVSLRYKVRPWLKKRKKNQPTNQEPGWVDGGVPAHKAENTESSKLHTGSGRGKLWNTHAWSGGPNLTGRDIPRSWTAKLNTSNLVCRPNELSIKNQGFTERQKTQKGSCTSDFPPLKSCSD